MKKPIINEEDRYFLFLKYQGIETTKAALIEFQLAVYHLEQTIIKIIIRKLWKI